MNYEVREGKERLPEEEDIYGVNESTENEYDYEFWMPHEAKLRRRKTRLRALAVIVILAFVITIGFFEIIQFLLNR
ncbi:MAG: hypothetical protein K6T99_08070 [Armatimonadetes bacterium]|nr:hypothetical protein [Armatimonadota bacterium]